MRQIRNHHFTPLPHRMPSLPPHTALKPNKARRAVKTTDRGEAPGANGHPTLPAAPVTLALMKKPCCRESEAGRN